VIDLNHILLFIACISPLVMLGQTLRRGGLFRAWRLASLAVQQRFGRARRWAGPLRFLHPAAALRAQAE